MPLFGKKAEAPTNQAAPQADPETVEREVEAPDVFSVSEKGLWDGRPSLGGVWVAHPDVKDPERVIIRNMANGQSVIGALFRREREVPGPLLQVSSDAASALGLLAGAPTEMSIIALRKKTITITPPAPVETAEALPATEEIETQTLEDPLAAAAAAIDAAEDNAQDAPEDIEERAPAVAPASSVITPAAGENPLGKPYVQIGIFSVEANADSAAQGVRNAGLNSSVQAQTSQGKSFWRVIVGPANSSSARAEMQDKVRSLGYEDAYFVSN